VWRSSDGGASWIPLTDDQESLAIGSLAIAPSAPEVVYAGTGEGHRGCASFYGAGILKSTDGGEHWTLVGAATFAGTSVGVLRVDAADPDVVFAGNTAGESGFLCSGGGAGPLGLWRSTDGGTTWERLELDTEAFLGASDLVIDPLDPRRMVAGMWRAGVYRSTDGGATWTRLAGGLPASDVVRVDVAIDPTYPARLYAAVGRGANDRYHGTYRSEDGGDTWLPLPSPAGDCHYWALADVCTYAGSPLGNCTWNLYVDVAPDGRVWLGGLGVWNSGDRGATWNDACSTNVHIDQHAVAFAADGRTWIGNDGGVFVSADDGRTWTQRNEGLGIAQFYPGAAAHPANQAFALAGTQDNGTLKYDGAPDWTLVSGGGRGDGGFAAVDPTDPDRTWYVSAQFLDIRKTTDGGLVFRPATAGLWDANTEWASFVAPFAPCAWDADTLVAGTDDVWRTDDGAEWWAPNSSMPLEPDARPARTVALSPADPTCSTYFVAIRDDALYRTLDGGAHWAAVTPHGWLINDVAIDPADPATMYLGLGRYGTDARLLETGDALGPAPVWTPIGAGLPDTPIDAVVVDPTNSDVVWVGTDVGPFRSGDAGATWVPLVTGHPNVAVFDLAVDPAGPSIVSYTHGRGAFRLVSGGPGEAGAGPPLLTAARGPGEQVLVRYRPGCGATDHAIYWGHGPLDGALAWSGVACRRATTGIASFDPGAVAPGTFVYFVVVAQDPAAEGSYGRDAQGRERAPALGLGDCSRPQHLGGCSNVQDAAGGERGAPKAAGS
jgi:photosystem II stability/assembly factor-like uncharacterized protein